MVVDEVVVEVVVEAVAVPGIVLVVVEVDVEVEVVDTTVVVVGSPVILTTGGCTVTATIERFSWTCSLTPPDNCVTHFVTKTSPQEAR